MSIKPGLGAITNAARRAEVLSLYRDCLRMARCFYWTDDKGQEWSELLKKSARDEFEQARYEKDPLIVTQLLVVGRDSLSQLQRRFTDTQQQMKDHMMKTKNR